MLPSTDAVARLIRNPNESVWGHDVFSMLSLYLLDSDRLDVSRAAAACEHNLACLKFRQEHVAFYLSAWFLAGRNLHHNAVVTVVDKSYLEVHEVVPYMLRVACRLENIVHHVIVERWNLLICKKVKVRLRKIPVCWRPTNTLLTIRLVYVCLNSLRDILLTGKIRDFSSCCVGDRWSFKLRLRFAEFLSIHAFIDRQAIGKFLKQVWFLKLADVCKHPKDAKDPLRINLLFEHTNRLLGFQLPSRAGNSRE